MSEIEPEVRDRDSTDFILAALLARGEHPEEAARFAGVSRRTVYRRLENAEFRETMFNYRHMMTTAVMGRLLDVLPDATNALRDLLRHEDPNIQYKAAVKLIELGLRARDHSERDRPVGKMEIYLENMQELTQMTGETQVPLLAQDHAGIPLQETPPQPVHNCEAKPGANSST